jgi:hypothetical protein
MSFLPEMTLAATSAPADTISAPLEMMCQTGRGIPTILLIMLTTFFTAELFIALPAQLATVFTPLTIPLPSF